MPVVRALLVTILAACLVVPTSAARLQSVSAAELLDRVRTTYRNLRSLSTTVVLVTDSGNSGGPVVTETHGVTMHFRAPRHFFFEFAEDDAAGGDRVVIWCDGGDFQSWWKTTRVHEVYSGGRGATAFATASYPTRGAALHVAPLLFPQAQLHGPLTDFSPQTEPATESHEGRTLLRVTGDSTGHFGPARSTTIWVDAATSMVVKIVEDTPRGSPGGSVNRITTAIVNAVNPPLEDARFRFEVPGPARAH
ncbi:MAG: hypothetical protein R2708_02265 [Vicinamibacterales bacterium]